MEIVVTARHTEVPGRFRRHLDEKLTKVGQLAPRADRIEVAVSHEANKRQSERCERIELTLRGPGPVVRAEACAADVYSALDLATMKLMERLRRASDRRKVHKAGHSGSTARPAPVDVVDVVDGVAVAPPASPEPALAVDDQDGAVSDDRAPQPDDHVHRGVAEGEWVLGESPVVIRDKVHPCTPMGLETALEQMELVGHDFYLFVDEASGRPSVVYRRRGWSYGVLRLAADGEQPGPELDGAAVQEREVVGAR